MLPDKISKFISSRHLLGFCCVDDDGLPYAASCFYAFCPEHSMLYIASDENSTHIKQALNQGIVAGTIALDTLVVGRIQGVQFRAHIRRASSDECYFKRFAYARAMSPMLWQLELFWVKFTSNTLGFGKKIIWQHNEAIKYI
ncbi:hypothetical protein [Campylobacter sp. 19-13652]|uniref:hypothetical protein n=1 Tax=Campylobacter sp. 19-13652 TaxID=2840180 RepID=UPI001C75FBFF|nr:hypothetical protein [Campylobacter sp. 19-13652]BCX80210.1 UPF0306 protein YhbP [Campylobacter sp. 19-13652]